MTQVPSVNPDTVEEREPDPDHPLIPARGPSGKAYRRRDFCVTWNVGKMPDGTIRPVPVTNFAKYKERVRYVVWQLEQAPSTGQLHYQMYFELYKAHYPNFIKECLLQDSTAHIEGREKAREAAKFYCMKSDSRVAGPFEWGNWVDEKEKGRAAKRTDIDKIKDEISEGKSMFEIMHNNWKTAVRIPNGIRIYRQAHLQKEATGALRAIHVTLLIGSTGSGKSRRAYEEALEVTAADYEPNDLPVFIMDSTSISGDTLWFDGYEGGPLVIDELHNWIPIAALLKLLDIYPLRVATKGGFTWANWRHVWITTNLPIDEWTDRGKPIEPAHLAALKRRIHRIAIYDANNNVTVVKDEPIIQVLPPVQQYQPPPSSN